MLISSIFMGPPWALSVTLGLNWDNASSTISVISMIATGAAEHIMHAGIVITCTLLSATSIDIYDYRDDYMDLAMDTQFNTTCTVHHEYIRIYTYVATVAR